MKLKLKKDKYYPVWFESDNGEFAIGILNYLFRMKCLQVLHKAEKFYVFKEYKGYDEEELHKLLLELEKVFEGMPEDLKGEDWRFIDDKLPKYNRKYIDKK
jgi:hypothetical protein